MKPHRANLRCRRARDLGQLHGQTIREWPVDITIGERASLTQENDYAKLRTSVIAPSARDAADWAADLLGQHACVEIFVWGPAAGLACHRYWGWERAIWNGMLAARQEHQLKLKLQTHHESR